MALVGVFVHVLEVRIERVVIEIEIGVGVGRSLPCLGDREVVGVDDLRFRGFLAFAGRGRIGERPVVPVVANGADQLLFGDDLEDAGEIADEPLLAGDGAGIAGGLMLVVVHQDDAVGVGRDLLQIVVRFGDGCIDIEVEMARVQIGIELPDKAHITRVGIIGKTFKIERQAVIDGVGREELKDLLAQRGAPGRIIQHGAHVGVPALIGRVVVVQVGEDFRVFFGLGNHPLDAIAVIGIVDGGALNDGIVAMRIVVGCQQRSRGRQRAQPLGKEQVDLVDVLFERSVTCGIVLHIERGAKVFAGVQGNFGRFRLCDVTPGPHALCVARKWIGQRLVVVLGRGKEKSREALRTDDIESEADQNDGRENGSRVENAAQALPALALGIEEYLSVRHENLN